MIISDIQFDTSSAHSRSELKNILNVRERQPFTALVQFIESVVVPSQMPTFENEDNVDYLNRFCGLLNNASGSSVPIRFRNQELFETDERYYEQIIFETKQVPTRPNLHDFFNALIWCQFPKTKHLFNARHMSEIATQGSTKRTPIRDRMTHFDECGIVLFTSQKKLTDQLQNHQWQDLFVGNTANWHQQTIPVIFGHAIWEMLLEPFVGLTAKATVIEVSPDVMAQLQSTMFSSEFYATCDELLCKHINHTPLFEMKKPWLPLPLLGIPSWSPFPQTQSFYNNQQYFMPKRR